MQIYPVPKFIIWEELADSHIYFLIYNIEGIITEFYDIGLTFYYEL